MNKSVYKMSEEELQMWLYTRKRDFVIKNKKGKGSYTRKKKHKKELDKE